MQGGPALPDNTGTFFSIYFMMTGVHGVHVLVGIGVLIWIWRRNERGDFSKEFWTPIDIVALYWHPRRLGLDLPLPPALPDLKDGHVDSYNWRHRRSRAR